jgi:nicotinate dehydrogenase subunit A
MRKISFQVNGKNHQVDVDPKEPLLYVLREEFQLSGAKFGCGLQQCAACMVLVDGKAQYTCLSPCENFEGKKIETLEGLHQGNKLHPVQRAFIDEQAAQCGYCLNGMLISAESLLREKSNPSEEEIKASLHKVICRCGTHARFIKAVKRVVDQKY